MWVFDGEEWVKEGEGRKPAKPAPEMEPERLIPELQIVQIPVPRRREQFVPIVPTP